MKRLTLIPILIASAMMVLPADAQRRGAPVSQGITSGELASNLDALRVQNAETGAKVAGVEADVARLNGDIETLEFLLSQSRDQVNDMQADNAQLDKLITRLEKRLNEQDKKISALESKLNARSASALSTASTDAAQQVPGRPSQSIQRTTVIDEAGNRTVTTRMTKEATPAETRAAEPVTTGPTRIVRRTVTTGSTVTTQSNDAAQAGRDLPQGTLGTIPASALPGEAGPLFAEAKSRLLQFDYAGAESAFELFLEKFGDDAQAGEAQYWLGEALYQQQAYDEAGQAYTTMIREYPEDARAPEALAKLARAMRLVGNTEGACQMLDVLPQRYPDASGVTQNLANGERVRSGCDS